MLLARKLRELVHQTTAPKHPLLEASRPGDFEGLAGHALSQKVKGPYGSLYTKPVPLSIHRGFEAWRLRGTNIPRGLGFCRASRLGRAWKAWRAWKGLEA